MATKSRNSSRQPLRYLWGAIFILLLATPIGMLAEGTAWGEWGREEMRKLLGYIPAGFEKLSSIFSSPFPDYALGSSSGKYQGEIGYLLSGILGVIAVVATVFLVGKVLSKRERDR